MQKASLMGDQKLAFVYGNPNRVFHNLKLYLILQLSYDELPKHLHLLFPDFSKQALSRIYLYGLNV
jgi:hypothetical protein